MVVRLPLLGLAEVRPGRSVPVDNSFGKQIEHSLATPGLIRAKQIVKAVILANDHDDVPDRASRTIGGRCGERVETSNQYQ